MRWCLCVDESGDFERDGDVVVVAGIMLPAALGVTSALQSVFPVMRLPHGAELAIPAAWSVALWTWELDARRLDDDDVRARCAPGSEAIARAREELPALQHVVREAGRLRFNRSAGKDRSLLVAADEWLRAQHRAAFDGAVRQQEIANSDLPRLFSCIVEQSKLSWKRAPFVVGAAGRREDPLSRAPSRHGVPRDTYVDLLEAMLERVSLFLEDGDEVEVEILARDLEAHGRAMTDAQAHALAAEYLGTRLVSARVSAYSAPPLAAWNRLVLADLAAGAMRRAILGARGLGDINARLQATFGRGLFHGARALPTLAAGGAARDALRARDPRVWRGYGWRGEQLGRCLAATESVR